MILDIGAGPRSGADVQMDLVKWNDKILVHDIVDVPWPFEDESFDEVRAEQVLEHIPGVAYYPLKHPEIENKVVWKHAYPRVMVMKEIYRVLKPGGILHASVPTTHEQFSQDPTHVGPMWLEGTFNYFCGEWGGGTEGEFVNDAYGINFAFKKLEAYQTGFILTVRLQK